MPLPPSGINSNPAYDLGRCERCGTLHDTDEVGTPCQLCTSDKLDSLPRCRCSGEIPTLIKQDGDLETHPDQPHDCNDHEPRIRRCSANGVIFSKEKAEERRRAA